MRRRALCQVWSLSRIHRLLRPLRTKVSALATALQRERQSRLPAVATGAPPTPTPTRRRPPLRRTYQTRRRKRGDEPGSEEDEQYLPKPARVSKQKNKSNEKAEKRWSPEIMERVGAVVDAFRVLADVVYDEQMEVEGSRTSNVLSLRDMCVRAVAEIIEPYAVAAANEENGSDDDGELVDATKLVDEQFEDIPEHLRRAAIIPYALSMIKQHIDTVSPLPQLWNHILAICLSASAASSPANTSDVLQICSNLFFASLCQPRSSSRGLASVYRNVVGPGPDKIAPELFCRTVLAQLVPSPYELGDDYTLPLNFPLQATPIIHPRANQSPMKTPARQTRGRTIPPTPPTRDLFSNQSDDPSGVLFPIRAVLSRPVAHLVAELGRAELLSFIETTAVALLRWIESDEAVVGSKLREHRADAPASLLASGRKASDVRSLVPRVCARIGDWTVMALAEVWTWPEDADSTTGALGRAALALGQVAEAVGNRAGNASTWIDIGDPFCALACAYLAKQRDGDLASKVAATLRPVSLTARNCNILAGTLALLQDDPSGNSPDYSITFTRTLKAYARAFARAQCPHLEATLLQLVLNERIEAECEVEEMLEDAEARWDGLEAVNRDGSGGVDGWKWARSRWRWDEITNTWVEKNKGVTGLVYVPRAKKAVKVRERVEAIVVSSDTEGGQPVDEDDDGEDDGDDEDDVFAAIPATTRYAVPSRRQPSVRPQPGARPRPRTSRITYISSDVESDAPFEDATARPRTHRRTSFLVDDSESETGTRSERSESSETDTDTSESDFDWAQYNGRYHPHDRVSSSGSKPIQPKEDAPKRTNLVPRSQAGHGPPPAVRPVLKPARVVSAPIPVTTPVKRPRVVVELPLPAKRPRVKSNPTRPRILGDHNTHQHTNSFSKPRRLSDYKTHNTEQITTSTISRLCQRFSSMSSDDDRDCMDVDENVEVDVEGTDDENEEPVRMDMPSSDDMDLFQIVTPVPRRVKAIGRGVRKY